MDKNKKIILGVSFLVVAAGGFFIYKKLTSTKAPIDTSKVNTESDSPKSTSSDSSTTSNPKPPTPPVPPTPPTPPTPPVLEDTKAWDYLEGKAIKCNGKDEIYMVSKNLKRWVSSLTEYSLLGSPNVTVVTCSVIDSIPSGEKI